MLIDADLRRPTVSGFNGSTPTTGLSDYLSGEDNTVQPHRASESTSFSLIPAGHRPPNPTSLLKAGRMRSLLEDVVEEHEFAVIDTSALGVVADALPLLSYSSGVVIVARVGTTRKDSATRLRELLTQVNAPVLGFIANDVPDTVGPY